VSSLAVGILLAVAASVALNASFVLQHAGAAHAIDVTPRRPVATLRSLLSARLWLLGAVVGIAGWVLHIGALSHAPLSLVQAFVAGGLALTVPMAAIGLGHELDRRETRAALLMVLALVLLSIDLRDTGRHASFQPGALAAYCAGLAAIAGALSARAHGDRRPAALGLAGGLLYGVADLAIKALTGIAREHGLGGVLVSPWLGVAALATVAAFFCFQRALQAGRPVAVIALMTAGTNAGSIAGALVVFGDPLGRTPVLKLVHVTALVLVGVAAWRLAPSQAALSVGSGPAHGPARDPACPRARGS
jgi:drug/metabolite transporter (DMT)-like permease